MLTIKLEGFDELKRNLEGIRNGLGEQVATAALNKVGNKARTEMKRAISQEYNLNAAEVNSRLRLSNATKSNLSVTLDPFASSKKGRALNLIHFLAAVQAAGGVRKVRGIKGVSKSQLKQLGVQLGFLIKRAGGIKSLAGAFIGNHGRTIFIREGKGRLPIKPLSTIDVPQMFSARKSIDRVTQVIQTELPIEFDRALKLLLDRYK